jgi:hypothetical protein
MDWSSPGALALSGLKNRLSFQSRFMGHVFVEFKCRDKKYLTGMVGKNFDYLNQILIKQRGLGVLFHSFEGRMEEAVDVEREIHELSQTGERLNFVRFLLNVGQCERVESYYTEYKDKNVGRYYGLANRPRYGEGAGCSAFGASFVEVAGQMDFNLKESWSHSVNIPLKLAGPPVTDQGVNLFEVMIGGGSWASEQEAHQKLFFWDPDKMFNWVKKRISLSAVEKQFKVERLNGAQGIVFDRSFLPPAAGPIWLQHRDERIKPVKAKN